MKEHYIFAVNRWIVIVINTFQMHNKFLQYNINLGLTIL